MTLSYTLVTVGTLLVITLVLGGILLIRIFEAKSGMPPGYDPEGYIAGFMDVENSTSSYLYYCQVLSQTPQNLNLVNRMLVKLQSVFAKYELFRIGQVTVNASTIAELRVAVFRPDGTLLGASVPNDPAFRDQVGKIFDPARVPGLDGPFRFALAGTTDPNLLYTELEKDQRYVFVAPCFNRASGDPNQIMGVIALLIDAVPTQDDVPWYLSSVAGRSLVIFLLGTGIMGAIFGSYFAHGLTTRFNRLSSTTDLWSDGDFSKYIDDSAGDEISQFAGRLNNMARQLQSLLRRRQDMAVSEERNRLARDLHDSAKQQALAASFELGTALTLYERDPQEAKKHLAEADTLVDSVRRELTDLVDELRPQSMDGDDFSEILEEYGVEWSHRSGIRLNVHVEGSDESLPPVTHETLFRIAQEALANVARHSSASRVEISIEYGKEAVTLTIKDDGRGFDTSAQHSGLGLHSMQERAESLGGSFSVASEPGRGTRIVVTLPTSS
jgi:NarL family two-component system sensor histidine kinase LiaS